MRALQNLTQRFAALPDALPFAEGLLRRLAQFGGARRSRAESLGTVDERQRRTQRPPPQLALRLRQPLLSLVLVERCASAIQQAKGARVLGIPQQDLFTRGDAAFIVSGHNCVLRCLQVLLDLRCPPPGEVFSLGRSARGV